MDRARVHESKYIPRYSGIHTQACVECMRYLARIHVTVSVRVRSLVWNARIIRSLLVLLLRHVRRGYLRLGSPTAPHATRHTRPTNPAPVAQSRPVAPPSLPDRAQTNDSPDICLAHVSHYCLCTSTHAHDCRIPYTHRHRRPELRARIHTDIYDADQVGGRWWRALDIQADEDRVRTLTGKEIELDIEPDYKVCGGGE